MKDSILIYGGGGHAKTVIDLLHALGTFEIAGIVDDRLPRGETVLGVPVIGSSADLTRLRAAGISCAVNAVGGIGNPGARWQVFERLIQAGFDQPALVHPRAVVEPSVRLENAVQVLAGAYISSASSVAFGTLLNAGAILSHDNHLGFCVNLSPGATCGGDVTIGDYSQIGMRATVNAGLTVGSWVRIGNGATVKENVPDGTRVYAGTIWPRREKREIDPNEFRKIA